MNLPLSARTINWLIVAVATMSMIMAYYFEYIVGLEPCPLCMTQRVFVVLVGCIALVAALHNPAALGLKVYAGMGIVAAIAGGYFSGRQLWLQSLPEDQVPACGPPLEYIMQNFPLLEALQVLLTGDGNCAEVVWQFLGLSMPAWVLIIFIGLIVTNISHLIRK